MRVLIVEDEVELSSQLKDFLVDNGFAVDVANSGEDGLYLGTEFAIDVAVVDLGLPDLSGMDIIRQWRENGRAFPVLILTARSRWEQKVEGLRAGADDYLVKPFHYQELLARLNALIRRFAGFSHPVVKLGPVELDTASQVVRLDGKELDLTAYEYKVLEYLMLHKGQVVTKMELTEHIYDQDFDRDSNVIEVFIGRLRKKLDPEGSLQPIETLRGRGYRFNL